MNIIPTLLLTVAAVFPAAAVLPVAKTQLPPIQNGLPTTKAPDAADSENWSYLGTGTISDGWVIPGLAQGSGNFLNPSDYIFEVEISESKTVHGVYLLHSPYTSAAFPFLSLNGCTEAHDIIVDASDPSFVTVQPQESGFELLEPGDKASRYATPYMVSNSATMFLSDGYSKEEISQYGLASTFNSLSGTIKITYPVYTSFKADGTLDNGYSCSDSYNYPTIITLPASAPLPQWESIGFGTFEDGFITTGYIGNPPANRWKVEVLAKEDEPGIYMLKNAYTSPESPYCNINLDDNADNLIRIDASNPGFIYIEPQYTGFTGKVNGEQYPFFIGNSAGAYLSLGYPKFKIEESMQPEGIDTLKDGVITVNFPLFGATAGDGFGSTWMDGNGNIKTSPAYIWLPFAEQPGDSSVTNPCEDETVPRYFNLQGLPLADKPSGIPCIEIKGGKTTKRIF